MTYAERLEQLTQESLTAIRRQEESHARMMATLQGMYADLSSALERETLTAQGTQE